MAQLRAGEKITTAGRTIGEGDVNLFAGLVGDFTPIHVDAEFAAASPHGVRIAHGPLAMSTAIGLMSQTGFLGERVIGLVNLNWDFSAPVKIGDTIRAHVEVEDVRPTSKPDRKLATLRLEVVNQSGGAVQRGRMLVVVRAD
jgi:acyl dehydratase